MDKNYIIEKTLLEAATIEKLAEVTANVVENGASVGFMHPFTKDKAIKFWNKVKPRVESGDIMLLIAKELETGDIIGTVQLILDLPENQPHRADVAKMQVHSNSRRRGVGRALLQQVEAEARSLKRTLLVLDTATGSDGFRLYSREGWQKVGDIPAYALWPDGQLCSSTYFYKELSESHN